MRIDSYKKYIIALVGFLGVCVLRFFDMSMSFHSMPMGLMQNYRVAQLVTLGYFVCFFVVAIIMMSNAEEKNSGLMSYLIMFTAVFMFPMFLNENYFGTSDVYAWIICFGCLFFIIIDKLIFFLPIGCFVMTMISPMSMFSVSLLVFAILLIRYVDNNKKVYVISALASIVLSVAGMIINVWAGVFSMDVQHGLSLTKFIVSLVLFVPYIIFGYIYLLKLLTKINRNKKICYIAIMVLGLVAPAMYIVLGDFSRAIFYGFVYYILIVLMEVFKGNNDFISSMSELGSLMNKYIAFPAILIAYPFVIMTMWVSGPVTLFEETFVGL